MTDLTFYKTLVFDCDGVVLNSNKIKTRAFYDVASIYGHKVAKEFKDYQITDKYTELTEKNIRLQPEFYLWSHKRFKHRDKVPKEFQ